MYIPNLTQRLKYIQTQSTDCQSVVATTERLAKCVRSQLLRSSRHGVALVLGKVLIQLSGGIQRIIIALWVSAHRVAFEREKSDNLLISDFIDAARIYLAPIAPAIKALNSGEPSQTSVYEDMID